jgi:hypothetical protein
LLVFAVPMLGGIVGRTRDGGWWPDLDAIVCAGARVEQGFSAYGGGLCPGAHPAAFVYAPIVAQASDWLVGHLGASEFRLAYVAAYILALAMCAYEALLSPLQGVTLRMRAMFMALVTGTLITAGNVGVICHGAIIGTLLGFPRRRAPFIAMVALASLIKPTFATYLVVLLLEPVRWTTRFVRMIFGVGAVGAAAGVVAIFDRAALQDWGKALRRVVLTDQAGRGFLGWAAQLGLDGASPVGGAVFVALAVLLTLAGLSTVRRAAFGQREVVVFGVGLAQLLNPRLMTYDELALAPMAALTCLAAAQVSPTLGMRVRWGLALACVAALAAGCVGWMSAGQRFAAFALTVASLVVGLQSWRRR